MEYAERVSACNIGYITFGLYSIGWRFYRHRRFAGSRRRADRAQSAKWQRSTNINGKRKCIPSPAERMKNTSTLNRICYVPRAPYTIPRTSSNEMAHQFRSACFVGVAVLCPFSKPFACIRTALAVLSNPFSSIHPLVSLLATAFLECWLSIGRAELSNAGPGDAIEFRHLRVQSTQRIRFETRIYATKRSPIGSICWKHGKYLAHKRPLFVLYVYHSAPSIFIFRICMKQMQFE